MIYRRQSNDNIESLLVRFIFRYLDPPIIAIGLVSKERTFSDKNSGDIFPVFGGRKEGLTFLILSIRYENKKTELLAKQFTKSAIYGLLVSELVVYYYIL